MNVSTTLPETFTISRGRLIALLAIVAALAAAAAWAVTSAAERDTTSATSVVPTVAAPASTAIPPTGFLSRITDHPTVVHSTAVGPTGTLRAGFTRTTRVGTECGTIAPATMPSRECQRVLERLFLGTR